jgi:glycerol-3-phosphate dehydrogenase (NAD(P)+)
VPSPSESTGETGRVAVVGAGAWGTALAVHAARVGHRVTLWAFEPEVAAEIEAQHTNSLYLPGARLPDGLRGVTDVAEAVSEADLVVLVPPSKHLRRVSSALAPHLRADALVVVATKGIEQVSLKLMNEVLEETLPAAGERLVVLSGPSFAKEVFAQRPTDVVAASRVPEASHRVQELLHTPMFRVYGSADPIGVEVGGAVKNVIAVAVGAADGLGLGPNSRAALITRGLAEMTRLGVALGGEPLTFLGLAGVGDLILTCTDDQSRNRTLGKRIAEGVDPAKYVAGQVTVAEGYLTSAACWELAQRHAVDMPITEQVFHVLHHARPLHEAANHLLNRAFKDELQGIDLRR